MEPVGLGLQPGLGRRLVGDPPGRTRDLTGRPEELGIRQSGRPEQTADLRPGLGEALEAERADGRTGLQVEIDPPGGQMGVVDLELELERLGDEELER